MVPLSPLDKLGGVTFFDDNLNPSQKEAVRFALASSEVACIHGPPGMLTYSQEHLAWITHIRPSLGTGKTHTLIEIIRQLTSVSTANPKPLRLLVCGASNLSVDNILERLLALPAPDKGDKIKVTRVGHPARVMSNQGVLESTLEAKSGRSEQVRSHSYLVPNNLAIEPPHLGCVSARRQGRTASRSGCSGRKGEGRERQEAARS
jgi:DNA polymerase alpha-associated DNA helicase A